MSKRLISHVPSCPPDRAKCKVLFTHHDDDVGVHYHVVVYETDDGRMFALHWSTEEGEETDFDFKPERISKRELEKLKLSCRDD